MKFSARRNDEKGRAWREKDFFDDDGYYRWVIRHATGEELSKRYGNGRYSVQQPIDGLEDYYRYYEDVYQTPNLLGDPEVTQPSKTLRQPKVGCVIGTDGRFYAKNDREVEAAAVVIYLGAPGSVETGTNYRGLAIATHAFTDLDWQNPVDSNPCSITPIRTDWSDCANFLNGLASTKTLAKGCNNLNHNHPAAKACIAYNIISANDRANSKLSEWFIPSAGQWALFLRNRGCQTDDNQYFTGKTLEVVDTIFGNHQGRLVANTPYMTSTVKQNDLSNNVSFAASLSQMGFRVFPRLYDGSTKAQVLQPFIAFEFGGRIDDVDDDDDIIY